MKKQSKVKKVSFNQTFEMNGDTFYAHSYTMEDGAELNANHKSQKPFNEGDAVEYEVTGQDKFGNNKGKVGKPSEGGYGGGKTEDPARQKLIAAQSSAATAAQFYQERSGDEDSVLKFAEKIYDWVMSKA